MNRGGSRPGSGRKPGSRNVKTLELLRVSAEKGLTPLDVMLDNMRHWLLKGDREKAHRCAADAAPYLHAKLSSIDANINSKTDPLELRITIEEHRRRAVEEIRAAFPERQIAEPSPVRLSENVVLLPPQKKAGG